MSGKSVKSRLLHEGDQSLDLDLRVVCLTAIG